MLSWAERAVARLLRRSFNAIMGRAGSCASLQILFSLLRSKCVPALLYGIKLVLSTRRRPDRLNFQLLVPSLQSQKLHFPTWLMIAFRQFSDVIADKKNCFNTKDVSSNNIVCKTVSAWTLN